MLLLLICCCFCCCWWWCSLVLVLVLVVVLTKNVPASTRTPSTLRATYVCISPIVSGTISVAKAKRKPRPIVEATSTTEILTAGPLPKVYEHYNAWARRVMQPHIIPRGNDPGRRPRLARTGPRRPFGTREPTAGWRPLWCPPCAASPERSKGLSYLRCRVAQTCGCFHETETLLGTICGRNVRAHTPPIVLHAQKNLLGDVFYFCVHESKGHEKVSYK